MARDLLQYPQIYDAELLATLKAMPSVLTGPGAIPLTNLVTYLVTTGADALTLADGVEGQLKLIVMKTDGGDGVLTPANFALGSTITFADVGDSVLLQFHDGNWYQLANHGAPVIA